METKAKTAVRFTKIRDISGGTRECASDHHRDHSMYIEECSDYFCGRLASSLQVSVYTPLANLLVHQHKEELKVMMKEYLKRALEDSSARLHPSESPLTPVFRMIVQNMSPCCLPKVDGIWRDALVDALLEIISSLPLVNSSYLSPEEEANVNSLIEKLLEFHYLASSILEMEFAATGICSASVDIAFDASFRR
jgi:hypothetical protein